MVWGGTTFYPKVVHGDNHMYDNELPHWLAIGPICWEAKYNASHYYIKSVITTGYINIVRI